MAADVGQQVVAGAPHMVAAVPLHHDAVRQRGAVVCHHLRQVGHGGICVVGDQQQLAAALEVGEEHLLFIGGDIALGGVNDEGVGVLGYALLGEQAQLAEQDVFLRRAVGQGGRKLALPVAGEGVYRRQVLVGHVVDGGGELALSVKLGGGGACGVVGVVVGDVDVVVADIPAPVPAGHDQGVVVQGGGGILLGEVGGDNRVYVLHLQFFGQVLVALQQLSDGVVLGVALDEPVHRDLILQGGHHLLSLGGEGVEPGAGQVGLGPVGGEGPHHQVDRHGNGNDHRRCRQAVTSCPEGPGTEGALDGGQIGFVPLHQLHLRFSMVCTARKRATAMMER